MRPERAFLLAVLAALACGCSSSRFYDMRFQPAPNETEIATDARPEGQVRGLATVIGVERPKKDQPGRAIVRMRLENLGKVEARLDGPASSLVSADLQAFGTPEVARLEGGGPDAIPAGGNAVYELRFPLPEGRKASEVDFSGLSLRYTVVFDGHPVTISASFQRVEWRHFDDRPRVGIGVGFGWSG